MAKTIIKNSYETWNVIYNNMSKSEQASEKGGIIAQERIKAKAEQDNGFVLGGMHKVHYRRWINDKSPMGWFLSYINKNISCYIFLNSNYLLLSHALLLSKHIKSKNRANIKQGRNLIITYNMIRGLGLPMSVYRNYKVNRTVPIEYLPVDSWDEMLKKQKTPWRGKFYGTSQKEADAAKIAKRKRRNKRKKARKKK